MEQNTLTLEEFNIGEQGTQELRLPIIKMDLKEVIGSGQD